MAYLVWALTTLTINSPAHAVSIGGAYFLEVYGSYALARNFIRTPEQFRTMCSGLFLVLAFSIPFAIYETQTGIAPLLVAISKIPGIPDHVDYFSPTEGLRLGLYRSQVIFPHPILYGLFCSSLFSLALVGFKTTVSSTWRFLLVSLVAVGVIASVSSGAILPVAVQLFLVIWGYFFRQIKARWIILSLIMGTLYIAVDIISNRTAIEVFLSYAAISSNTAYGRVIIFEWGMVNVWENPFFGIGLNDWKRPEWLPESIDNFWLLVTMRFGFPGLLLLVAGYFSLLWRVVRRDIPTTSISWRLRLSWAFVQVSMVLTLCTVDVWDTALSYVFFLLGAGAWMANAAARETHSKSEPESGVERSIRRFSRFSEIRYRDRK